MKRVKNEDQIKFIRPSLIHCLSVGTNKLHISYLALDLLPGCLIYRRLGDINPRNMGIGEI